MKSLFYKFVNKQNKTAGNNDLAVTNPEQQTVYVVIPLAVDVTPTNADGVMNKEYFRDQSTNLSREILTAYKTLNAAHSILKLKNRHHAILEIEANQKQLTPERSGFSMRNAIIAVNSIVAIHIPEKQGAENLYLIENPNLPKKKSSVYPGST